MKRIFVTSKNLIWFLEVPICFISLFIATAILPAEPLHSESWGFRMDLPEGYIYTGGNNFDRYSFDGPNRAKFEIAVYNNTYRDIDQMASDVNKRLGNTGDVAFFIYGDKAAALIELDFMEMAGWGLCVELAAPAAAGRKAPLLLALAYAPAGMEGMDFFHLSALNSISPSDKEMFFPGPVMEFGYPRENKIEVTIPGTGLKASIYDNDAEAAQALVDREYILLTAYHSEKNWQAAWTRFYRMIYRDSWHRVEDTVSRLYNYFCKDLNPNNKNIDRLYANKALAWVQGFEYERDFEGSDFVNIVSAITEGRGDCDSRAMLWAMILIYADIPAAIMVSADYSHAMGLADIQGAGARFKAGGINWLVAETTAKIDIGLIDQKMSNTEKWLGVFFY